MKKKEMRLCLEMCQINNQQLTAVDHTAITSAFKSVQLFYLFISCCFQLKKQRNVFSLGDFYLVAYQYYCLPGDAYL